MNEYDIVLDVLVVNQTNDTLQGLSLELATLGNTTISTQYTHSIIVYSGLTIPLTIISSNSLEASEVILLFRMPQDASEPIHEQ